MTELPWRINLTSRQKQGEFEIRHVLNTEYRRSPATTTSTTWLRSSEKRMQEIARRTHGEDSTRFLNHSSQSTNKTTKRTSVLRELKNMTMQSTVAQAEVLLRVVRKPADSIVLVQLEFQASFMVWRFVNNFSHSLDQFRMPGENFQTTDGSCEQNTHSGQHVQMRTVCHNTYWTEGSHFITRTRMAQDCTSLCLKIVVIHVSCLVPSRTWQWPQAQVLYHLPHLSFRRSLSHTQVLWRTIHIYPAKIHGRVADQHKSHLSQVLSPKWSSPKTLSLEELSLTGILGQIRT